MRRVPIRTLPCWSRPASPIGFGQHAAHPQWHGVPASHQPGCDLQTAERALPLDGKYIRDLMACNDRIYIHETAIPCIMVCMNVFK
jgi:hypothetical protein